MRPPLPPARRVVNTMPLSVSVEAGIPCVATALSHSVSTIGPVTGGDPQGEPGAVVEPGQDLGVGAGSAVGPGEPVVGEVGLPAFVGHRGFEADAGRLRPLLRFWVD